ncbi:MAG: hypothetical protein K8J31_05375 [Anaerolineae bacterium]|nr:hypothetical protein [Anaerolineae bacterium]
MENTYHAEPEGTYETRRQEYLEYCAAQPPASRMSRFIRTSFFSQIARLELGRDPVDEAPFRDAIAFVDSRQDCCDFSVGGLLRVLYRYPNSPLISPELIADIEACILRFKFWWDEPQGDNHRCYWTENHQIIFHADELLAGQLFASHTFHNSERDGHYHIEHALHLIRRWFDFRARFGFSEWLSNCYFEEDLLALVNLHDFAQQPDIRHLAKQTIDLLMFEMALHTYRGIMGSTHGRTYPRLIKGARHEDATNTARLMFGMGLYNNPAVLGTVPLATSSYRCPPVFERIAADLDTPRLFKEHHSLDIADAPQYGLAYDDLMDGHLFWSIQDYTHERIYDLAQETRQKFGIMLYEDYQTRYDQVLKWQEQEYGRVIDPNIDCHGMTAVDIQTYRTADYMLSCAQDYRAGKPGYQQHPWQATLGVDAVVFTNHPGSDDEIARPNYWAGNGILPRAVQHQHVLICLHHVPADDAFPFSHAYFPREAFDDVMEADHWVCARKGDGYIALYSQTACHWRADENGKAIELRAAAPDNIWVVEMGDSSQWPDFATFVQTVTAASLECTGLDVRYQSPTLGWVEFGWQGPLRVAGAVIPLHDYPRFDNPYCQAEFGVKHYTIQQGGETIKLDFQVE